MPLRFLTAFALVAALSACAGENRAASQTESTAQAAASTEQSAPAPAVVTGTDQAITPHASLPTVIDFNAVWCPPCRRFGPIFDQVAEEMKGKAIFVSVDVDNAPTPARQFGVSSIPQISVLMPDGKVVSTVGFMTREEFVAFLQGAFK